MDTIQTIRGSMIQHGPHNDRIYLMRLAPGNDRSLIHELERLARQNRYGKIFAKIPADAWPTFEESDFQIEAVIPGLFNGKIDGFFIAKYCHAARQRDLDPANSDRTRQWAQAGSKNLKSYDNREFPEITSCALSDAPEMSAFYKEVFRTYPFPIDDPTYLQQMINQGVPYYAIRNAGRIAALAATEIDWDHENAEMTDFATLPNWRGHGYAGLLLDHMEHQATKSGLKTVYTIARAASRGMNHVFQNRGYTYSGLLKNNSQICGAIQSMTIWYKHLSALTEDHGRE